MSDEPSEDERREESPREDVDADEQTRKQARETKNPDSHRGDEEYD
jgi:hypothetical protein